jgi:ribosomal protein S18 acetylase RimI-like enzyme
MNSTNCGNALAPAALKMTTPMIIAPERRAAFPERPWNASRKNLKPAGRYNGFFNRRNVDEHRTLDNKLKRLNYEQINMTSIQVCKIPGALPAGKGIIISDNFSAEWINSAVKFNGIEKNHTGVFKKILANILTEKIVVQKTIDGKTAGCGYAAIENGYAGLFDIVVQEKHRGKGYGREIVRAILSEAANRGIKNSYLQVMLNNPIALNLYEKMGYREIYRYWYRKKAG